MSEAKQEENKGDPEAEEDEQVESSEPAVKVQAQPMKRGDYMVHVFVEQAKKMKIEANDTVDPIVQVEAMGKKAFTTAKNDIDNMAVVSWNEHLFLDYKNCEPEQLEKGTVQIKLMDKGLFKDEMLGFYSFDINWIYLQPDHAVMHKWVVMSNPNSENFSDVTAYFKLSIVVVGQGDENIAIENDPNPDTEDILTPPQIKPEFFQMTFRFIYAERIVPLDWSLVGKGNTDLYFKMEYRGKKLKTSPLEIKENQCLPIGQEFLVPMQKPLMTSRVVFTVWDEDAVNDEKLGSVYFDIKELMNEKNEVFFWKNIYGAPLGVSGKVSRLMNDNPELGSLFKGRVLMQCITTNNDKPKFLMRDIDAAEMNDMRLRFISNEKSGERIFRKYQITAFIQSGMAISKKIGGDAVVEIRIAEHTITTGKPINAGGRDFSGKYARFNHGHGNSKDLAIFEAPYMDKTDIGSVFVYLKKGDKRICFARLKVEDFFDENAKTKWITLAADNAIGSISDDYKAGIVGFKLYIRDVTELTEDQPEYPFYKELLPCGPVFDTKTNDIWKPLRKSLRRLPIFKVRAYIFQARDLPPADSDGTSDPEISAHSDGTNSPEFRLQTLVIDDNMNPMYYEALEYTIEATSVQDLPPFIFDCMDFDDSAIGSGSFDFLCRATIDAFDEHGCKRFTDQAELERAEQQQKRPDSDRTADCLWKGIMPLQEDAIRRPHWYPMKYGPKTPKSGELLASFAVVDGDAEFVYSIKRSTLANKRPLELEKFVHSENFEVKINLLGLRNLASPGMLPVKKAFVYFNVKSLTSPRMGANLVNLKTEARYPGSNPTMNTTLSFNVDLPTQNLYCPRLACTVYDQLFAGISQPIIGNFVIPIGDLMHELQKERDTELKAVKDITEVLEKLINGEEPLVPGDYSEMSQKTPLATPRMIPLDDSHYQVDNPQTQSLLASSSNNEQERLKQEKKDAIKNKLKSKINYRIEAESLKENKENTGAANVPEGSLYGGQVKEVIPPHLKLAMKQQHVDEKERKEREQDEERKIAHKEFKDANPLQVNKNVIKPVYQWDYKFMLNREKKERVPPPAMFLQVGWERDDVILKDPNAQGKKEETFLASLKQVGVQAPEDASMFAGIKPSEGTPLVTDEDMPEHEGSDDEFKRSVSSPTNMRTTIIMNMPTELQKQIEDKLAEEEGTAQEADPIRHVKHYRRFYNNELEKVKEVLPNESPFDSFDIKRGQTRGKKAGFFASLLGSIKTDESGQVSSEQVTGKFKGIIEVESKEKKAKYDREKEELFETLKRQIKQLCIKYRISERCQKRGIPIDDLNLETGLASAEKREQLEMLMFTPMKLEHLKITQKLADIQSDVILKRMLLHEKEAVVRVYILDGRQFASRDIGGDSDPYLKIKIGDTMFNERENYQLNEANPDFFKSYDAPAVFPGCAPLVIEAWDYDDLFSDDLIGTTVVDLEDRFFLMEWNALKNKPVEARELYHPSMSISQGIIRMWVEINDPNCAPSKLKPHYDITPRPAEEFEVRVAILDGSDIKMMDVEDTSDAFIRCFFDSRKDVLETDTHYRLMSGKKASWNYRLNWMRNYTYSQYEDHKLTVQLFDRDFFKSNDIIGSATIDLGHMFEDCALTKKPITLTKTYYEDQIKPNLTEEENWTFHKEESSIFLAMQQIEDQKVVSNGIIRLQIDIRPGFLCEKTPVGHARGDPNHTPFLPPPIGRISFTLNPWKMFCQLVGPAMRAKICKWMLCIFSAAMCIYILPNVIGGVITSWIT